MLSRKFRIKSKKSISKVTNKSKKTLKGSKIFIKKRPLLSFVLGLLALFIIIALSNVANLFAPTDPEVVTEPKDVVVFNSNQSPEIELQARITKKGVIEIIAQTSGVVQKIHVNEGDGVSRGTTIVSMSSNYQGGSIPSLQYSLVNKQYQNITETYDTQKDIINKQREVADKTLQNTEEQRKIAGDSANDTNELISKNNDALNQINEQIKFLEDTNVGGANDQLIAQAKQARLQIESSVFQLESSLRNLDYLAKDDSPASDLSNLSKDLTFKQLEIQEKALDLKEVTRIQRDIAGIQASLMNPASPSNGTVERIFVNVGDLVNPGTKIAIISTPDNQLTAEVLAPFNIVSTVSRSQYSTFDLNGSSYSVEPYYISNVATSGQLYSILYNISEDLSRDLTDNQFVPVRIPIGFGLKTPVTYIPIDAVYQTQTDSYVFVIEDSVAVSKKIELGDVFGSYVRVNSGLVTTDNIILNRNIVSGDDVRISSTQTIESDKAQF